MNKEKIINSLIEENGYENYLEIGYGIGKNFHSIVCQNKLAIDIETPQSMEVLEISSDSFFATNNLKFDLIFIDGDHDAKQVEKDIFNSWYALKKGGVIVLHDVKPYTKEMQIMPRKQLQWTGNVWRAFYGFKNSYEKIKTEYIEEKYGIGLIWKSGHSIEIGFVDYRTKYEEFIESFR